MSPASKALLQIHFCVVLWGFTAILGKLITLPALALVWWRMLIVVAVLALLPRGVARGAGAACPHDADVRGDRRGRRAALAHVLRRHQARERIGRGDLHGRRADLHGAGRALGSEATLRRLASS